VLKPQYGAVNEFFRQRIVDAATTSQAIYLRSLFDIVPPSSKNGKSTSISVANSEQIMLTIALSRKKKQAQIHCKAFATIEKISLIETVKPNTSNHKHRPRF